MSRPEASKEPPSLEESLALVRKIIAEGPTPARQPPPPLAASGTDLGDPGGMDLPAVLRSASAAGSRSGGRGSLTEALRGLTHGDSPMPARPQPAAIDDDLSDLIDAGPTLLARGPAAPATGLGVNGDQPGARASDGGQFAMRPSDLMSPVAGSSASTFSESPRDLSSMDARVRARVAPSLRGEPAATGAEPGTDPREPFVGEGPSSAAGEARKRLETSLRAPADAYSAPQSASPAARLPPIGSRGLPPVMPAKPDAEPAGWPRGAVRPDDAPTAPLSAPPSEPVVIAAMPPLASRQEAPVSPAPRPHIPAQSAPNPLPQAASIRGDAGGGDDQSATQTTAPEAESRFEVIASMAPAPRRAASYVAPSPPPAATPEATAAAVATTAAERPDAETAGAGAEAPAAAAEPLPVAVEADAGEAATAEVGEVETDPITAALGKLAAGLAAAASNAGDMPAAMPPPPLPDASGAMSAAVTAGEAGGEPAATPAMETAPAMDLSPGADGAPADAVAAAHPHEPEVAAPMAAAEAMLKLVGTSVALGHDGGAIEAPNADFDDAVAELLRPMLRKWLETNMPRIVEKALRKELAETTDAAAPEVDQP